MDFVITQNIRKIHKEILIEMLAHVQNTCCLYVVSRQTNDALSTRQKIILDNFTKKTYLLIDARSCYYLYLQSLKFFN